MSTNKFTLREIQPTDSDGLTKLITDFDGDLTTRFQVDPYQAIVSGTENRTTGVVVEEKGQDGLIGMGTVRFGTTQFNNQILPFVFLDGLKVRPEFRGQGLGYQIASWRLQRAREEYGDECVIGTGLLHDNHASHAVAKKWCREFLESAVQVFYVPTVSKKPKSTKGITAREIEVRDYQEFAAKQNKFFSQYNLYPPSTADTIAHALDVSVEGRRPYRYFVVVDSNGNLLAGAQTWARGLLKCDTINQMPTAFLVINKLAHLLPPDLTLRDVLVSGLWHETGQEKAAQYLWDMMRWTCRDQGNTLTISLDTRDPGMKLIPLKPWYQPRPKITLAIHGPSPVNRDKLLFASGRV